MRSRIIRSLLIPILIAQIGLPPQLALAEPSDSALSSQASNKADSTTPTNWLQYPEGQALQREILLLEYSGPKIPPPGTMMDTWDLTDQFLDTRDVYGRWQPHNLATLNLNLPKVVPSNFDRDVKAAVDPETGELVLNAYNKSGQIVARHRFRKLHPIAMARDRELLMMLDPDGFIYGIDMGLASQLAFNSPMPVVQVVQTGIMEFATRRDLANLRAGFITRGLKPFSYIDKHAIRPLDLPRGDVLRAGNLAIFSENRHGRVLLGEFDRSMIKAQMYRTEATVAFLAYRMNPNPQVQKLLETLLNFQKDNEVAEHTAARSQLIDLPTRQALEAIQPEALHALAARADVNNGDRYSQRDLFGYQEWWDHFIRLRRMAILELQNQTVIDKRDQDQLREALKNLDLGQFWRPLNKGIQDRDYWRYDAPDVGRLLFKNMISPQAMRKLANFTMFVMKGAASGAVLYGMDQYLNQGHMFAWILHAINNTFQLYAPPVLKASWYWPTLLKNRLAEASIVPAIFLAGFLFSNFGDGWKAVTTAGLRVWGATMLPFYYRLAKLLRQPNVIKALQMGLSPLEKVEANSNIGRLVGAKKDFYPALNNPFLGKQSMQARQKLNAHATSALHLERARAHELAWTLALIVASEENGMDPATLTVMVERGGLAMTKDQLQKMTSTPDFRKRWSQIAGELYYEIQRLKRGEILPEIKFINKRELGEFYGLARMKAKELRTRTRGEQIIAKGRLWWRRLWSKTPSAIGSFAMGDYDFLMNIEPSNFTVTQFRSQFIEDYLLSIAVVGTIGARANLNDTQALAAQQHRFMWASPGDLTEAADQARIYTLKQTSNFAQTFQRRPPVHDDRYNSLESLMIQDHKQEPFFSSVLTWFKGALNFHQARYGKLYVKRLGINLRTIQAGLLFGVLARLLAGGQSVSTAFLTFLYTQIWGEWQFNWIWTPISQGNNLYDQKIEDQAGRLGEMRRNIGQGMRLMDLDQMIGATRQLRRSYVRAGKALLPKRLDDEIIRLEILIGNAKPEDLARYRQEVLNARHVLQYINRAVQMGTPEAIDAAQIAILNFERRRARKNDDDSNLVARHLRASLGALKTSMRDPPFATRHNKLFHEWVTNAAASVLTAVWFTAMSVFTFRPGVHWIPVLAKTTAISAGIYLGLYMGEWAFVKVWDKIANRWRATKPAYSKSDQRRAAREAAREARERRRVEATIPKPPARTPEEIKAAVAKGIPPGSSVHIRGHQIIKIVPGSPPTCHAMFD